ncbi:uncharacterized protein LOC132303272 [Cornus florida]|uniref:uncharacterized protein LOC132303272 n=1 Tax=Cornus florida TaxID=4283 RepID=UPI00289CA456|nr:uncharacterized protein LOC132303272 [Cornus florida]
MILPASDLVLPCVDNAQEPDEIYNRATDVCLTAENLDDTEFLYLENPKMLVKKASLQKEKQISVDPISLRDYVNPRLVLPPVVTTRKLDGASVLPPLLPAKPKFLSTSLPGSATSSPRFGSGTLKKKWKNSSQVSSLSINPLFRQHSGSLYHLAQLPESDFRRCKSHGEGRASAPSDEFDMWLTKVNGTGHDEDRHCSSMCRTEVKTDGPKRGEDMDCNEEKFKCGALCLFLPGFGKGKPVRARKEGAEMAHVISRTVSLEKFECGSWTSSAIMNGHNEDDRDSMNHYFDLPLELIRSGVNEAHSPVRTAFVFDKDLKGVLKKGRSRATPRKSHESPRRVRFSTSSPASHPASPAACITPRLRKARDDFNAFLEAQGA